MGSVTLTELRTRARTRANMPVAGFVSDSELDGFLNEGVQRLHGKLVEAYGEEYVESTYAFSTVAGTTDYSLPADFYKLYGIDMPLAGRTRTLRPYNRQERNIFKDTRFTNVSPPRYALVGSKIRFAPSPPSADCTMWYAPEATKLVLTTDTVTFPNGWEKFVVAYAAVQMLMKEESDTRPLQGQLNQWEHELDEMRENRDIAFPRQATDVEAIASWDERGWP